MAEKTRAQKIREYRPKKAANYRMTGVFEAPVGTSRIADWQLEGEIRRRRRVVEESDGWLAMFRSDKRSAKTKAERDFVDRSKKDYESDLKKAERHLKALEREKKRRITDAKKKKRVTWWDWQKAGGPRR